MQQTPARNKPVKDGAAPKPAPTYPDLAGKVAVVTGGSLGIGAATARLRADSGVRVAVNGRDQAATDTVIAGIASRAGQALGVPAHVTDPEAIQRMRTEVERQLGPTEVLVAFAGGAENPSPPTTSPGPVMGGGGRQPHLDVPHRAGVPAGDDPAGPGRHRHLSSTAGRLPGGASAAYTAAKAGVVRCTRQVANEVARHRVRVNCVAPGRCSPTGWRGCRSRCASRWPPSTRWDGLGMPEDVAQATLFLVSDASSWLTGVTSTSREAA